MRIIRQLTGVRGRPLVGAQWCKESELEKIPMISIIDDDVSVREATRGLVRSLGYEASEFQSAEDFLHSDEVDATDCIITDINMSGLSGLDLQERLQADGRSTPVILITAFPQEHHRTRAMRAGAIGFFGKPFDDEALIDCLEKAIA